VRQWDEEETGMTDHCLFVRLKVVGRDLDVGRVHYHSGEGKDDTLQRQLREGR
jgi:hypothetical protein